MISKRAFVSTMNRLKKLNDKIDNLDNVVRNLCSGYGGLFLPDASEIVVDLLTEMFDDKEGFLEYLVYEENWLTDFRIGDVTVNDKDIDLSTWDKVYDFFIDYKDKCNNKQDGDAMRIWMV